MAGQQEPYFYRHLSGYATNQELPHNIARPRTAFDTANLYIVSRGAMSTSLRCRGFIKAFDKMTPV